MNNTSDNTNATDSPCSWESFPNSVSFVENIRIDSLFFPLFDGLLDVSFFLKNRDGIILLCNRQFYKRFGFKSEWDIIGKTDFDLHPHKMVLKYKQDDAYVMNSGKPLLKIIEIFQGESGIPSWYLTDKYPVFAKSGEIIGVMGIIRKHEAVQGNDRRNRLGEVLKYIESNSSERIDIKKLAKEYDFSPRSLERIFAEQIGLSPKQYIIRRRVFLACQELRETTKTLSSIAVDCGFYDQSTFNRTFKRVMGITPQVYRNLFG